MSHEFFNIFRPAGACEFGEFGVSVTFALSMWCWGFPKVIANPLFSSRHTDRTRNRGMKVFCGGEIMRRRKKTKYLHEDLNVVEIEVEVVEMK